MAFQGEIESAFLKSSVDLLVHKFSSPEVQRILLDAEGKQTTKEGVKDWLDEVQHVVHEAEDLLDVIFCQARGSKLEPGYFNNEEKIINSLNDILERLGELEKRAHTLNEKQFNLLWDLPQKSIETTFFKKQKPHAFTAIQTVNAWAKTLELKTNRRSL
ncbi:hypothetical protein DKX38_027600 [Salix brachista]|uniref:Disease resistance N-terminal domain-containing protein n=1 Tax=Salix brachista TaxID=2182728 RepID=A0A5N5J7K9_9ROSI|nr:hypothetical protein DKX38_027600 [Salix brachista]